MKKCPVCKAKYSKDNFRYTKLRLRNISMHIKNRAKIELFNRELIDKDLKCPHLDYIKKNYCIIRGNKIKI